MRMHRKELCIVASCLMITMIFAMNFRPQRIHAAGIDDMRTSSVVSGNSVLGKTSKNSDSTTGCAVHVSEGTEDEYKTANAFIEINGEKHYVGRIKQGVVSDPKKPEEFSENGNIYHYKEFDDVMDVIGETRVKMLKCKRSGLDNPKDEFSVYCNNLSEKIGVIRSAFPNSGIGVEAFFVDSNVDDLDEIEIRDFNDGPFEPIPDTCFRYSYKGEIKMSGIDSPIHIIKETQITDRPKTKYQVDSLLAVFSDGCFVYVVNGRGKDSLSPVNISDVRESIGELEY